MKILLDYIDLDINLLAFNYMFKLLEIAKLLVIQFFFRI